jgi:hypothetical protein
MNWAWADIPFPGSQVKNRLSSSGSVLKAFAGPPLIASEQLFFDAGEPDLTAMKATATESSRPKRLAAVVLDDPYFNWPEAVARQIVHIRSNNVGDPSPLNTVANATRFEDSYYASYPALTPEQTSAA